MSTATVVSLSVRPSQASHLCFALDGILGESNTELGASVKAFDFAAFYATLGAIPTIPGHPARLLYDFLEIQASVKPFALGALRAEAGKAALNKAINARANAYYAKYANAPDIISRMTSYYSPKVIGSKPNRLDILTGLSKDQMTQLNDAYEGEGRKGVVKTTNSKLDSTLESKGTSKQTGQRDEMGVDNLSPGRKFDAPPPGGGWPAIAITGPDNPVHADYIMEASGVNSTSTGSATEHQTIENTDYGYRIPYLENLAQFERAQISLIDEQFAQFMYGQNLDYLSAVFQNELNSIDSDVFRLQIAYLNTILMSPIAGTVTGVYKNPGEAVRAGEPIIRVENNEVILLVASLIFRGRISIGDTVAVETRLFDSSGPRTPVKGKVVAARGQRDDDQWEVIVKCKNLDSASKPILPFGYHFDYDDDDTIVDIS